MGNNPSPILVPTLAELGIELEKALAALDAANAAERSGALPATADGASDQASDLVCSLSSQIAELPATSLRDLRVKALALTYWQAGSSGVDDRWPIEDTLARQLAVGLVEGLT